MSIRPTSPSDFPVGIMNEQQTRVRMELIKAANKVDLSAIDRILPQIDDADTIREVQRLLAKKEYETRDICLRIDILKASDRLSDKLWNLDDWNSRAPAPSNCRYEEDQ